MENRYWKAKTEFYPINKAQTVRSKGCNSIAIQNLGNGRMFINNAYILEEGDTFINSMPHPDVFDDSEYSIRFEDLVNGVGVAVMVYTRGYLQDTTGLDGKQICEQF